MKLGLYPALKLADARNKALKLRSAVIDGSDPSGERAAAKLILRTGETVAELAEGYFVAAAKGLHGGRRRPKRARTIAHEKGLFERYIRPKLGDKLFIQIHRTDIKAFMRDFVAASELAPATIARVGEVLSSVFGFAVHEDRLQGNPVAGLAHPLAVNSRERRFDDQALRILWNTFVLHSDGRQDGQAKASDPASRLEPLTCLAARFIMITLCRRNEATAATWDEFDRDNKLWVVPRERTKSGRTEVKPLSAEAMAILEVTEEYSSTLFPTNPSRFVFPSTCDAKRPMADERVTRAITRLCDRFGLPHGSPHDFRRSGATTLTNERYGFSRFIVSQVLGHAGRDGAAVTAVYDRNDYLPQKRAALEAWAGHILGLGAEPPATKCDRTNSAVRRHSEVSLQL